MLRLANEVAHQRDPYCDDAAKAQVRRTRCLDTLGAHLLPVRGDKGSRGALQQLWEIPGQTLLDGKSKWHVQMNAVARFVVRYTCAL